jgi:hypothetical protein
VGSSSEFVQQGRRPFGGGTNFFLDQGIKLSLLSRWQGSPGITGCAPSCHELPQASLLVRVKEAVWA